MSIEERLERMERLLVIGTKNVLNTAEAALMLGVSESRVRHLCCERRLPYYKQCGKTYYRKQEIEDWMLAERIPTDNEISSIAATRLAVERIKH